MRKIYRIAATTALAVAMAMAPQAHLAAQIILDVPPGKKEQKDTQEKKQAAIQPSTPDDAARQRAANSKGKVLLGIGSLGVYSLGGGETHDGQEVALVNPKVFMTASYFFIDGLAFGLFGTFQYSKSSLQLTLPVIPILIKTTVTGMGGNVGLIIEYYFRASDRIFPYLGITVAWGMSSSTSIISTAKVSGWEIGAHAGMNIMIAQPLGLFLEISHIRDFQGSVNPTIFGYVTSINLGLKVFI